MHLRKYFKYFGVQSLQGVSWGAFRFCIRRKGLWTMRKVGLYSTRRVRGRVLKIDGARTREKNAAKQLPYQFGESDGKW